ncbi:MAG: MarP family serine protease [Sporichthyaceae bacterium]
MNWLDLLLVLSALSFGYSGYRQGFVVGVLSFAGFIGGGILGLTIAPPLVEGAESGVGQTVLALGVVLICATLGQLVFSWVGGKVRDHITWSPAVAIDAALGALVSVLAMLLVTWFLASALRPGPSSAVSEQISQSRVIRAVDQVMPEQASTLFSNFRRVLDANGLPTVFGGLSPEPIRPVDPPDPAIAESPQIRAARDSIVMITGTAPSCSRQLEGSGFVYAARHVMTNAHVVAGVRNPVVRVGGAGTRYPARVTVFDPRRDLAVLYVPDLRAPALAFDFTAKRGVQGVVAGFPGGGPYKLEAARFRDTVKARGDDIYGSSHVTREIFSLYADVEPGNSGGPLLSLRGGVYGVVFAKSLDDPNTGYALTADEVAQVAQAGRAAQSRVSTRACA